MRLAAASLSIVIPCYNEELSIGGLRAKLAPVLAELTRSGTVEVVFVDDGSEDRTPSLLEEIATSLPFSRVVRHPVNRGLGAALATGIRESRGEIILTTDSDGTYEFSQIPKLLSFLTEGIDIVTASPYHPRGGVENVPAYRLILSRGASLLYRCLVSWRLHTYTSMFRAYRRQSIRNISVRSEDFLFVTEILVKSLLHGAAVVEFPTVLRSRRAGASKARVFRIMRDHVRFLGRILLYRTGLRSAV